MTEPIDGTLGAELGKLGEGGGYAASHLPSDRFEIVVDVRADPGQAEAAFSRAIARLGRLLGGDPGGPQLTVAGVVGGGFMNMNPAVVEVRIAAVSEGHCRATLTGTAKEGLVKQRAGRKAVQRVLGARELVGICGPAT